MLEQSVMGLMQKTRTRLYQVRAKTLKEQAALEIKSAEITAELRMLDKFEAIHQIQQDNNNFGKLMVNLPKFNFQFEEDEGSLQVIKIKSSQVPELLRREWYSIIYRFTADQVREKSFMGTGTIWAAHTMNECYGRSGWDRVVVFGLFHDFDYRLYHALRCNKEVEWCREFDEDNDDNAWVPLCHVERRKVWYRNDRVKWAEFDPRGYDRY